MSSRGLPRRGRHRTAILLTRRRKHAPTKLTSMASVCARTLVPATQSSCPFDTASRQFTMPLISMTEAWTCSKRLKQSTL